MERGVLVSDLNYSDQYAVEHFRHLFQRGRKTIYFVLRV